MQTLSIIAGAIYSIASFLIVKKLTKKEEIKQINHRIKQIQKNEITEKERMEILRLVNKSLMLQMKPLLIVIPIFFLFYSLIPTQIQTEFVLVSIIFGIILNIISEIKFGGKNEKE